MTRLRTTAALAATLLLPLPLAACTAPHAPQAGDRPLTSRTAEAAEPGSAAPDRDAAARGAKATGRVDTSATDGATEEDAPVDPAAAAPAGLEPVDAVLGTGIDLSGLEVTEDVRALMLTDPSVRGADSAAYLFVTAWGQALTSGDGSTVRSLSAADCAFCDSVADSAETTPLGADLELTTTVWPVTVLEPTESFPHRVVVVGLEHLVGRIGSVGETVHVDVVSSRRQLVRIAVVWTDGAWWVHGADAEPWDGSDPLGR
jgi:hypothetical protein